MTNKFVLFGLTASKKLAARVAKNLNIELGSIDIKHFADGETMIRSNVSLRDKDVFVIQSTSKPVNENIMELLVAIDSFKRNSAKSITVITPYFGYARQDRKTAAREPITCKLVCDLIENAGATRIAVVDLHSEQAQGFFNLPVDTISASYMLLNAVNKDMSFKNCVIVSPDYGSVKRARKLSQITGLPIAILDKRRPSPNHAIITNVLGDIKNKNCIIVDDMIDTGGTLLAGCKTLKEKGAKKIVAVATHGLFNGDAAEKFIAAAKAKIVDKVYVSNSIDYVNELGIPNMKIVDLSKFLAEIIKVYISNGERTISWLYSKTKNIF